MWSSSRPDREARVATARLAAARVAGALAALGTVACGPLCPDAWEGGTEHELYCEPPPSVTEAAESALETGIYGYVLACTAGADDTCSLEDAYFYAGDRVTILPDLPEGGAGDPIDVKLGDGGTFEVELPPGVACHPANPIAGTYVDGEPQPELAIQLAEGEVRFVLFKIAQRD